MQAGDSLVAVEGKDVSHLPVQQVAKLFAGKPGSVCIFHQDTYRTDFLELDLYEGKKLFFAFVKLQKMHMYRFFGVFVCMRVFVLVCM